MIKGFEADDVIGSMAKRCAGEGLDVYMVTPDKDYGQLIGDHIWQYKPGKSGSDNEIIGVREICRKYGIDSPTQVIDMLTICGDTADNVPGVKGIGEVGAGKLVARYGSVKGIYEHLDELTPRQKAQFEEARDHIGLSQELVTIKTDINVDVLTEEMKVNQSYGPELADLFEKYEFNSLSKYIGHVADTKAGTETVLPKVTKARPAEVAKAASKAGLCSLITEGADGSIFTKTVRITVGACSDEGILVAYGGLGDFKALLENAGVAKCGDDLKRQMNILAAGGVALQGRLDDIALMHYLLDPEKSHKLDVLSQSVIGVSLESTGERPVPSTGSLRPTSPARTGTGRP